MVLDVDNYIGSALLYLKSILVASVTDPLGATRDSSSETGAKFILTGYPERSTQYPHITIKLEGQTPAQSSGQGDESLYFEVSFELRVWGRNMKEKDNLMSKAINVLRRNQITLTNGSIDFGLSDLKVGSIVPVDEEGSEGIKSNIAIISYNLELNN